MDSQQLELLFDYISNETAINVLRSVGSPWNMQLNVRNELKRKLRKTVGTTKPETITTPKQEEKFKLTPLKIEMLLALSYLPRFTSQFKSLGYPAQQSALEEFNYYGLINVDRNDPEPYALTGKGNALVAKILSLEL